jgi:hypothetical protein
MLLCRWSDERDVRPNRLFWLGLFFIGMSADPLVLMAREVLTGSLVEARYRVVPMSSQTAVIGAHRLSLSDDAPASADRAARVRGAVRVAIDGRAHAVVENVEIRPSFHDANRYHGVLALLRYDDLRQPESFLAVVVNAGVDSRVARRSTGGVDFDNLRFRVIALGSDGRVSDETFLRKDRGSPPLRAALARFVASSPMGYHSDLMAVWPSLLYPIVSFRGGRVSSGGCAYWPPSCGVM